MATYYVDKRTGNDAYTATQAQNPLTPWKTLRKPQNAVPAGTHTVSIAEGSGPYFITDLGNLAQNSFYVQQSAGSVISWLWNGNTLQCDVDVNTPSYKWTKSTAAGKTDWYYLTAPDGSIPQSQIWDGTLRNLPQVKSCVVNGVWSATSTNLNSGFTLAGRFAADNWCWGNYDSLAFSTLYVKIGGGISPSMCGPIMVPLDNYIFRGGFAGSTHKHYNGTFRGANIAFYKAPHAIETYRCTFINTDASTGAFEFSDTGANQLHKFYYNRFIDCGHAAFFINTQQNVDIYNNFTENTHTVIKIMSDTAFVVNYFNNSTKNLLAGVIQKDVATPTLNEDYNQHHVDPDTRHGVPAIAFTASTRQWVTTGAHDIPASVPTSTFPGVDGRINEGGKLRAGSPCVNAGVHIGESADIENRAIKGNPDIGAYEFCRTANGGLNVGIGVGFGAR